MTRDKLFEWYTRYAPKVLSDTQKLLYTEAFKLALASKSNVLSLAYVLDEAAKDLKSIGVKVSAEDIGKVRKITTKGALKEEHQEQKELIKELQNGRNTKQL